MAMGNDIRIHKTVTVRDVFETGIVNAETSISIKTNAGTKNVVASDPWIKKCLDKTVWDLQWIPDENQLFIDCTWVI